jgi:hypothetical protein
MSLLWPGEQVVTGRLAFTEVLDRLNALGISVDVIDADFSGSVQLNLSRLSQAVRLVLYYVYDSSYHSAGRNHDRPN